MRNLKYQSRLNYRNALFSTAKKIVSVSGYHLHERAMMARDAESYRLKNENCLNEFKIYYIIRKNLSRSNKLDKRLDQIPLDDILQAIRLAMLENAECEQSYKLTCAYSSQVIAAAKRGIRKLCSQFGFCGKHELKLICSYTNADLEQFHSQSSQDSFPLATAILDYYESHTVRETCAAFGIEFNQKIARAFAKYFCKHEGNRKPTKTPEQIRQQNLLAQKRWRERKLNSHVIAKQNAESV